LEKEGVFQDWVRISVQKSMLTLSQAGKEVRAFGSILQVLERAQRGPRRLPHHLFESLGQHLGRYVAENIPVRQPSLSLGSEFFEIQGILKEWDLQYELN
jgi:hypothetical protein